MAACIFRGAGFRKLELTRQAWLENPHYSAELGQVVQRLLRTADELYRSSDSGIERLPLACRMGIRSARLIYSEIGGEIVRNDFDSVSQRAVVPAALKMNLIGRAFGSRQSSA